MNTGIIKSCYNELLNKINDIKKQIELINLNVRDVNDDIDEARKHCNGNDTIIEFELDKESRGVSV